LDEPLLLELDLLAVVLALELDFFDALELPDLVGMALSFRRAQPPAEITVPTRGLSSLQGVLTFPSCSHRTNRIRPNPEAVLGRR
jgi:hypothetical protein